MTGRSTSERGGATVLAVVLVGVLATVAVLVGVIGGVLANQRRVAAAADLAALAGAGSVQAGGDACTDAASLARRNGGRLTSCVVRGEIVSVRVERRMDTAFGRAVTLEAEARAGPT